MFKSRLKCSFCGRSADDVGKLVAGPRVYICDRCAAEVVRIMDESGPCDRLSDVHRAGALAVLQRGLCALVRRLWRPHVPFCGTTALEL